MVLRFRLEEVRIGLAGPALLSCATPVYGPNSPCLRASARNQCISKKISRRGAEAQSRSIRENRSKPAASNGITSIRQRTRFDAGRHYIVNNALRRARIDRYAVADVSIYVLCHYPNTEFSRETCSRRRSKPTRGTGFTEYFISSIRERIFPGVASPIFPAPPKI